jgi:hypothetical protein
MQKKSKAEILTDLLTPQNIRQATHVAGCPEEFLV